MAVHALSASICMQDFHHNLTIAARAGADPMTCCSCIKSAPRSGQAWRGKHCAPECIFAFIFAA
nr:MAG TPA: hypothetical protein [Bacteriophage sp.]